MLNEFFPHKVCINLDRRPERWQWMRRRFAEHDIRGVERVTAVDGGNLKTPDDWRFSRGAFGCLHSHLNVVREAHRLRLPSILIFEDDVLFADDLRRKIGGCLAQTPPDWQMLHWGALHMEDPIRVSDGVARMQRSCSTYAYALRDTMYESFINLNIQHKAAVDVNNFDLQREHACYCFLPHLAWVETVYSDTQNQIKQHWYLEESLVIYGDEIRRILSRTTMVVTMDGKRSIENRQRNAEWIAERNAECFPEMKTVFVEQSGEQPIDDASLPDSCQSISLDHDGSFNRAACFAAGIRNASADTDFFILTDGDMFLEPEDLRANLRICERYDAATGCNHIIDLNECDSRKLREERTTRQIELRGYDWSPNNRRSGYCLFARRGAAETLAETQAVNSIAEVPLDGQLVSHGLRVFSSPNRAFRTYHTVGTVDSSNSRIARSV